MCTSLTFTTKDNNHLLCRNLDWYTNLFPTVILIPRKYEWYNNTQNSQEKNKYAILCMANVELDYPIVGDGLNEFGLMGAGLALQQSSKYATQTSSDKYNTSPTNFLLWALGNFKSIDELDDAINKISIVLLKNNTVNFIPALHWIFSDKTGRELVIESINGRLKTYSNTNGVLTNSPSLGWHLINLHQYIGLGNTSPKTTSWNNLKLTSIENGNGSFGMPGDFSSISRFVRASYLKNFITDFDTEIDGVIALYHILNNCSTPKGVDLVPNGDEEITIYSSVMCAESGKYYYNTYNNTQINVVDLFKENLDADSIKVFPYRQNPSLYNIN